MITLSRDQHRLLTDAARDKNLVYTTGTGAYHTTTRPLATAGQGEWRAPARRCDRDLAHLVDIGLIKSRRTAGPYHPTRAGKRYLVPPSLTQIAERAALAVRARGGLPEDLSVLLSPILDSIDDLPALTAILTGALIPCHMCPNRPVYDPGGFAQHHLTRHATRLVRTTQAA